MDRSKHQTLTDLAHLLSRWNAIGDQIAALIGRPAQPGHIAEFVASLIFDIRLASSAAHKGADGTFTSGPLSGASVNVKWSGKHEKLLNLVTTDPPDYYLVLTGQTAPAISSRGRTRPWRIDHVFIFQTLDLHKVLEDRGIRMGEATSVISRLWQAAEVFPTQESALLILNDEQRGLLSLFGPAGG